MTGQWYSVAADGVAVSCMDSADAERTAARANRDDPGNGPYRAVLLVEAQPPAPKPDELVLRVMGTFGGSFVKALVNAYECADPVNQQRLADAFRDLFDRYSRWPQPRVLGKFVDEDSEQEPA